MPELQNTQAMLEAAERAAMAGDLAAADELLANVARVQEAELGALHPELANTVNNRAILAEKAGRLDDAERFYRRAAAIAAASLPADHPMVVASRQNLEDFCHARDLPVDAPAAMAIEHHELGLHSFAEEEAAAAQVVAAEAWADEAGEPPMALADSDETPAAVAPPKTRGTPAVEPAVTAAVPALRASSASGWIVGGIVAVAAVALLMTRPWSSAEAPADVPSATPAAATPVAAAPSGATTSAPAAGTAPPPAPVPAAPAPAAPAPATPEGAATPAPATEPVPPAASSTSTVTLAAAELCRTLSTSGGRWRCDAAGDAVPPGPLVFYTRVRAARDGAVVHRWYRGDALEKTVRLTTRANPTEGYRTYSRQTVDTAGNWRVEARSAAGELLHEQRFVVR